jgi:predicted metal-dependent HD superfamily phosphohydrolase
MNTKMQLRAVRDLVWRDMPRKEYHNPLHADDVSQTAGRFARLIGMDEELVHLEETAGLIHDIIHVGGASDNEEQSAMYGRLYLPRLGYKQWEVDVMADMIVGGTKIPQNPRSVLDMILADADVYNAGRDDFLLRNDLLRKELGLPENRAWYESSLKFLENVNWWTEPARHYGEPVRQQNIEQLSKMLKQAA